MNLYRAYRLIPAALAVVLVLACEQPTDTASQPPTGDDPLYVIHLQNGAGPSTAYDGCTDTTLFNGSVSGSNYGGSDTLTVGTASSGFTKRRALLKFELSNVIIPASVTVKHTYLTLRAIAPGGPSSESRIYAYPMTTSWREGIGVGDPTTADTTWDDPGPGTWTTPGGDFVDTAMSDPIDDSDTMGFVTFELDPSTVEGWVADPTTNHGLVLKHAIEETVLDYVVFLSSDYSVPTDRPILTIYYSLE